MTDAMSLEVGSMLPVRELVVTPERVQWYGDGMHSAATGELRRAGENIHTDAAYAQGQGLSTAIADGMMSTAWISIDAAARRSAETISNAGSCGRNISRRPTSASCSRSWAGSGASEQAGWHRALRPRRLDRGPGWGEADRWRRRDRGPACG